jgi:hypothetical protein
MNAFRCDTEMQRNYTPGFPLLRNYEKMEKDNYLN